MMLYDGPTIELSSNIYQFVGEPLIEMLLVTVVSSEQQTKIKDSIEMEMGVVSLKVTDVFHSDSSHKGDTLQVPFKRIANPELRDRNRFDQWNAIPMEAGTVWILALKKISPPSLQGLAAIKIEKDGTEPESVRQCYSIEEKPEGSKEQRESLVKALTDPQGILRSYALDVLGRRGKYERKAGVEMIAQAIENPKTEPEDRTILGYAISSQYFFDSEIKNDEANQEVVRSLANGMVTEKDDIERQIAWVDLLASCVLCEFSSDTSEDDQQRLELIHSVTSPSSSQVVNQLRTILQKSDASNHDRITKLISAWVRPIQ